MTGTNDVCVSLLDAFGLPPWVTGLGMSTTGHPVDVWRRVFREYGHLAFPRRRTSAAGVGLGLALSTYVTYSVKDPRFAQTYVSLSTLAADLGSSRQAVGKLAHEAEAVGWWERDEKKRGSTVWRTLGFPRIEPCRSADTAPAVERTVTGQFSGQQPDRSTDTISVLTSQHLRIDQPSDEFVAVRYVDTGKRAVVHLTTAHSLAVEGKAYKVA